MRPTSGPTNSTSSSRPPLPGWPSPRWMRAWPGGMGWEIGTDGFRIVLSAEVPTVAEKYLGEDVRVFLAEFGLATTDIEAWVCHPGGPKVIEAVESVLELSDTALDRTRESLRDNG